VPLDADARVREQTGFPSVEALGRYLSARSATAGLTRCEVLLDTGCNQACLHCFLGDKRPVTDLGVVERLLDHDLPAAGLEPWLYFSEPFAWAPARDHAQLERLVRLLARHQRQLVLTNGVALDERALRLLVEHGPFRLYVSLLGARARTHEALTQRPGSFDAVRRTLVRLAALRPHGVLTCLNVLLHRESYDELSAILDLATYLGVASVYLMQLHPGPKADPRVDALCLSTEQRRGLPGLIDRARREHPCPPGPYIEAGAAIGPDFHRRRILGLLVAGHDYCPAGRSLVALHPATGELYPCMKLSGRPEYRIGHWDWERGRPVIDLERNVLGRLATDVGLLQGACSPDRCRWAPICRGGCRAAAAAFAGGDLLAGHEHCPTRVREEA